jgi:hypothetical protein
MEGALMSKLSDTQRDFAATTHRFKAWIYSLRTLDGAPKYSLRKGDCYRSPKVFGQVGVHMGYGSANSNHKRRLAEDIILDRREGDRWVWCDRTEDFKELGEKWETMHPLARWGGRWSDGNHFSFEWEGMK